MPFQKGNTFSANQKGKHFTEEHKRKLAESKMGDKNPMKRPEVALKMRLSKTGKKISPRSEEHKKAISIAHLGKKRLPFSEEWIKNLSEAHRGLMALEKNPNWKGGKSFEPYPLDWNRSLKISIRERDNYVCQICNQYGRYIHHIDYDKRNCNSNNLITLCHSCHSKTNFNRIYWKVYFNNISIIYG